MKVLSVVHGPVYGGVHAQVERLHGPLAVRGCELSCLLPDEQGTGAERISAAGVPVLTMPLHRLRATKNPLGHAQLARSLRAEIKAIARLLRAANVDLVQAHGPTNPHAAIAGHVTDRAVVWQLPDTRAPVPLRRLAMPLMTGLADVVTSVGEAVARAHPGLDTLGDRMIPIYPPVDLGRFTADPERRARARAELGVPEAKALVGTVANLNPSKGHEYLISAAAGLREEHPEARFRILGAPSPPHPDYERRLRQQIAAAGLAQDGILELRDPGARVAELMPALDLFVLASVPRSEGMPTVLIEAMSCGVPVVATDVGSVREVVDDGRTGLVVPAEDAAALGQAVGRLLRDPAARRSMGEAGRTRAHERFGLDRLADLHIQGYELALRHRRARRA